MKSRWKRLLEFICLLESADTPLAPMHWEEPDNAIVHGLGAEFNDGSLYDSATNAFNFVIGLTIGRTYFYTLGANEIKGNMAGGVGDLTAASGWFVATDVGMSFQKRQVAGALAQTFSLKEVTFSNWTADANSFKTGDGMILCQTGTSDNLIVDISGLALATNYWVKIVTDLKSPGYNGNVRLVAVADTGCEIAGVAGALINFGAGGAVGSFFAKCLTHTSQAQGGLIRMVLKHATSPDTQAVTCDNTTDKIALTAHGLVDGMPVRLATGTPPTGLSNGVTYFVVNKTANDFQVALTLGGAPINFTTNGTTVTMANWVRIKEVVLYPIPARSAAKIAVLGDRESGFVAGTGTAVDNAILAAAADTVNVVTPGDMYDGTPTLASNNDTLRNALIAKGGNLYAAPGNWDYSGGIAGWKTYFGLAETYYRLRLGNVEFFFYDTNDAHADNDQTSLSAAQAAAMGQWLLACIGSSKAPWKIVIIHHPAYTSSTHETGATDPTRRDASGYTAMRWNWASLGVAAVLQSHDHVMERIFKDGVCYFTLGVGGAANHAFGTPLAESRFRSVGNGFIAIHDGPKDLIFECYDSANLLMERCKITRR